MIRRWEACLAVVLLAVPGVGLCGAEEMPLRREIAVPAGQEVAAESAPGQTTPAEWAAKLREWRRWVTGQSRNPDQTRAAARAEIAAIDDPSFLPIAIKALKTEKDSQMRRALIQPLAKFGGPEAVAMLVKLSVEDDNPLLREEAAKGLVGKPELAQHTKTYAAYLYKPLYSTPAAKALRESQLAVRQSASDPIDQELTKALIQALVEKRKQLVPYWMAFDSGRVPGFEQSTREFIGGRNTDPRFNPAFRNARVGRYAGYREGLVEVELPVRNEEAYQTLNEYTSQDYEFNQSSWRDAIRTMPFALSGSNDLRELLFPR